MTNERMALELSGFQRTPDIVDYYYSPEKCGIYDAVLKTCEWKDDEMDEKIDSAVRDLAWSIHEKICQGWDTFQLDKYVTDIVDF